MNDDGVMRASEQALLSPAQMARADRLTIERGTPGSRLMAAAGAAAADAIRARWAPCPVVVLCGPGNNGGDGWVIARLLREAGWPVRLASWVEREQLHGDAAAAARLWQGAVEPAGVDSLSNAGLIVDALLGAGLSRPLSGPMQALVEAINADPAPVCAIDVPTGLDGATGQALGAVVQADLTVTFFRRKPGHLLLPGRAVCGEVICADIGIDASVLDAVRPDVWVNGPDLWKRSFPWPDAGDHKYRRGHLLVIGGGRMLGAGRLASVAAARIGAGLVTLAVPPAAWPIQAAVLTSVMVEALPANGEPGAALADPRRNALLIGPGLGHEAYARSQVLALLRTGRPCVLDADALSAFGEQPAELIAALHPRCVLTPHEGEFARLFTLEGSKLQRATLAAEASGAVVLLKGADTVIADGGGRRVINDNAPANLATAGTGDVLAGMVAGLMSAGMPTFEAACAAAWLHGLAADLLGPGMLSEDLQGALPRALQMLKDLD